MHPRLVHCKQDDNQCQKISLPSCETSHLTHLTLSVNINGNILKRETTTKLLGFTINDKLNFDDHIDATANKISSNLRLFFNIRHLMNYKTSIKYYFNYIHPYLIYGIQLYYPLSPIKKTNPLFLLQKKALRLICKDHINQDNQKYLPTQFTTALTKVLPLPQLATYFTSLNGHNILNNKCPNYLSAPYTNPNNRSLRNQYQIPAIINSTYTY